MDHSSRQLDHRSGRAARQTGAVLIKDPPQIHFQRRVSDSEDFALELAEPIGFGDGGDSAEGDQRFRREPDHYSGMIPVSRRSEATLVF
jgi:hypothetical protein